MTLSRAGADRMSDGTADLTVYTEHPAAVLASTGTKEHCFPNLTEIILPQARAQHPAFAYRPEIDGLRALAVVPVVLFHAGIAGFTGGFVGVDVFFVISGFLITAILAREIQAGEFSVVRFYERRIRRIFPALLAMFAVCWIVASVLMMPHDFRAFGRSMVASSVLSSNLLFWAEGGYFDTAAELKPLLHTWSLSVEEHFYLVFPPLLFYLLTRVRHWKIVIAMLLLASLIACGVYTGISPNASFYLPVFRAWELLTGSLIALSIGFVAVERPTFRNALALLGVALIAWSLFTFDRTTVFPGFSACIPCMGAALIIAYSRQTVVSRVLSAGPMVWIGKISYSLYLWHWPIIVFTKYYTMRDLDNSEKMVVVCFSFAAAWLSQRFVETPFRDKAWARGERSMFGLASVATACCLLAGLGTYVAGGFPMRFSPVVQRLAQGASDTNPMRQRCDARPASDIRLGKVCALGGTSDKPVFALLGDSFGDALVPGIERAAIASGSHGLILTSSGCYPLEGVIDMSKPGDRACREFVSASLDLIKRTSSITDVILVGRWTSAALGTRFGATPGIDWFINDPESHDRSYLENRRVFERALARTIAQLKGKRIHIVSYIPEQRIDPPRTLALCTYLGRQCPHGISLHDYTARQAYIRTVFERLDGNNGVSVIDVGARLCSAAGCQLVADGEMLYTDDNHLSRAGSVFINELFTPVFAAAMPTK